MKDLKRGFIVRTPLFWAVVLFVALVSTSAFGQNLDPSLEGVPGEGSSANPDEDGGANSGRDGTSDSCVGECAAEDGQSGKSGKSVKGSSATGASGQQPVASPAATAAATSPRPTPRRSGSTTSSSGATARLIPTILLYANDLQPEPVFSDAIDAVGEPEETTTQEPRKAEEAPADRAFETEAETPAGQSGGFPLRRIVGVVAVLVALGSAFSLMKQQKPGRRSVRRI